jgi:hypothetical protein
MIRSDELRGCAADTDVDTILRSHEDVCEQAADTIDALLGLIHDSGKDHSSPLWWCMDVDAKAEIETSIFRLLEERAERVAVVRSAAEPGITGREALERLGL